MDPKDLSGAALAYLGDAVFEVLVRERLLRQGIAKPKDLNRKALEYVKASAQSAAAERLLPVLTEDEKAVFRRGRNASGISAPKSANTADYRRATGLEALFGMLYLQKNVSRAEELFSLAFPQETPQTPPERQNARNEDSRSD